MVDLEKMYFLSYHAYVKLYTRVGYRSIQSKIFRNIWHSHRKPDRYVSCWVEQTSIIIVLTNILRFASVEHHLCQFVANGNMHNIFTKFLREDGMGIDYDKVSYSFKDPRPNDKNW